MVSTLKYAWLGYLERPHVWFDLGVTYWKTLLSILGVILLVGGAVVLLFTKEAVVVSSTGFDWEREYSIQNWQANQHQGWYYPPSTAYNVSREWRVSGQTQHKICTGTGNDESCTVWYTDDYDWYYWYTNDEWTDAYHLKNIGYDQVSPKWPDPPAECSTLVYDCKRVNAAWEHYRVTLTGPKTESWTCEFDQMRWAGYTLKEQFNLTVGKYTRIPQCEGLKPQ